MAKILLIDDMRGVRRAVASILKGAGHVVTEADNGNDGIRLANESRYDLVITDILMPEKDGTEVIMAIRSQSNPPPILAISGGGAQLPADLALMMAQTKADDTLAKPFENEQLLNAVNKLLAKR